MPGVTALAHMLGFEGEDALAATDFSTDVGAPQVAEASAALQGAIFTTRHLPKNQAHVCQGVSAASWLQTLFEPDDTVAAAAAQAGMPLTVAEYYAQVHTPLRFPNLPCLTAMANDGETVLFFPLEVCKLEYAPLAPADASAAQPRAVRLSGVHPGKVGHEVQGTGAAVALARGAAGFEGHWSPLRDFNRLASAAAEGVPGGGNGVGVSGVSDAIRELEELLRLADKDKVGAEMHGDLKTTLQLLQVSLCSSIWSWRRLLLHPTHACALHTHGVGTRRAGMRLGRAVWYYYGRTSKELNAFTKWK